MHFVKRVLIERIWQHVKVMHHIGLASRVNVQRGEVVPIRRCPGAGDFLGARVAAAEQELALHAAALVLAWPFASSSSAFRLRKLWKLPLNRSPCTKSKSGHTGISSLKIRI